MIAIDPRLVSIARRSELRLHRQVEEAAPFLVRRLAAWIEEMYAGAPLAERFLDPAAFPVLPLPWWLEESLSPPDEVRQVDLALSSMAGYLFIRLIDNVMDDDGPGERRLLPALTVLSTLFVRPYQEWFPRPHDFWSSFERHWVGTADLTAHDAHLTDVDMPTFRAISARKTGAANIPVAAICHLHGRPDLLSPWEQFIEAFGTFHQLYNDLHSWRRDLRTGTATLLLSEAGRNRGPNEPVADWLIREGLEWNMSILGDAITEATRLAEPLGSEGLLSYLEFRRRALGEDAGAVRRGAAELDALRTRIRRWADASG